jgi:hypothetical protein
MKPQITPQKMSGPADETRKPKRVVGTEFSDNVAAIIANLTLNVTEIVRRTGRLMFTTHEMCEIGRRTGLLGELDQNGTSAGRQIGAALGSRNLQVLRLRGAGDKWFLPSVTMDEHAREGFWKLTLEDRVALYHLIRDSVVRGNNLNGYIGQQPIVLDVSFWKTLADHRFTVDGKPLSKFMCPDGNILKRSNPGARSLAEAIEHRYMALIGGLGSAARSNGNGEEQAGTGSSPEEGEDEVLGYVLSYLAEKNKHPVLCHTPPYYRNE